jgi:myo-inositol-1(or 4)-monophosphatase
MSGYQPALMPDLRAESLAALAALRVGLPIVQSRQGAQEVRAKSPGDLVTGTDVLVQSELQRVLYAHQPDIAFVGEEGDQTQPPASGRYWLVDPVCGTGNYAARIPLFAINVALVEAGQVTIAAVADGGSGDLFVAERGRGAWQIVGDGQAERLQVSIQSGLVSVDPHSRGTAALEGFGPAFADWAMRQAGWDVRIFSTTLALAYVATGRLAGSVYATLGSPVHFAAGLLLAEEAGGIVTDADGAAWQLDSPFHVVGAGRQLHQELLAGVSSVIKQLTEMDRPRPTM